MQALTKYVAVFILGTTLAGCQGGELGVGEDDDSISDELRLCADGVKTPGIDVSYYQGNIDWNAVRAAGKAFAFIRTGDGAYDDPKFATYWGGAGAAGLYRGAYHFFRANQDPVAQADSLLDKMGYLGDRDLPAVLDMEVSNGVRGATVTKNALVWLERVEAATGRKPIIYTGLGYTTSIGNPQSLAEYTLWVANWTTRCPSMPPMWSEWKFWQNGIGSARSVPGIRASVDLDYFNGDLAALAAYAGPNGHD